MGIVIEWHKPIQLTKSRQLLYTADNMPEDVPAEAGVYYFSRKHGEYVKPFYIGESQNLRSRLKSHLGSVAIVHVLMGISDDDRIKQGTRYYHFGVLRRKTNQDVKSAIQRVERAMIYDATASGIPILNKNLTTIKTNTIEFTGSVDGKGWFTDDYEYET